jgi:hypothetical protein
MQTRSLLALQCVILAFLGTPPVIVGGQLALEAWQRAHRPRCVNAFRSITLAAKQSPQLPPLSFCEFGATPDLARSH